MQGRTENDCGQDGPWPVELPGESGVISSDEIEDYVNADFLYYYRFYLNCKHSGPPLRGGWTEWPAWVPQLVCRFDGAIEAVRSHNELQAYKRMGRV